MALFGLITKREHERQLAAIKQDLMSQIREPWLLATAESQKWDLPDPAVYDNQMRLYQRLWWVLAAVKAVGNAAALVDGEVKQLIAGEQEKAVINHPFETLLQHPNPSDSRFEFLYATIAMKKMNGNAYWWLNRTSPLAPPDEIWFIPPSRMKPIPDGRLYLKGYEYNPGNGQKTFMLETWEVVHFRDFNPFNRFVGLSAIESLALIAAGDLGMQAFAASTYKDNRGQPPPIMTFADMVPDPMWADIKREYTEAARDRKTVFLRGVGSGNVDLLQGVSQKDMELLATLSANKSAGWATLAPGLEAMLDPNATEANARAGRATFNDWAVYPELVAVQEKITLDIMPAYGEKQIFKFEDIRFTDRALELQEMAEYSKSHTLKEIREKQGDKPLGDERDDLLPVQINASTGKPAPEPPIPAPAIFQPQANQQQPQAAGEPVQQPDQASKAVADELARWQRKAMKRPGVAVEFISNVLSETQQREIRMALAACKTAEDVRKLFAIHEGPQPANGHDVAAQLEGLRLAVEYAERRNTN